MNRLMRFNPEPFDSEFEAESPFNVSAEGETFELEDEMESRGFGGGRSSRSRASHGSSRGKASNPFGARQFGGTRFGGTQSGGKNRSKQQRQPAPWPKGRQYRGHAYPVEWPYAVEPYARITPAFAEPPADPGASPSEYVTWAQNCLNGFLGLRLPVDGVMNVQTRGAIRMFQERRGLPINGRMGPETDSALREACRSVEAPAAAPPPDAPPPAAGPSSAGPSGPEAAAEGAGEAEWELDPPHVPAHESRTPVPSPGSPARMPTIKVLRENIVRIAKRELARWRNGQRKEREPDMRARLQDYWKNGAGASYSAEQLGSEAFQAAHPWSAAFISWVMRKAHAGKAFKYSGSHSVYISAAKANRIAGNNNPFKAYRLSEISPRIGDLICRNRAGSGATYDNIHAGMKTHCDIVVAVEPNSLTVIGGNVGNSVSSRKVRTDETGRVIEPHVFAVIRVGSRKPQAPGGRTLPEPRPEPTPVIAKAPKLLKQETAPAAATLYAEIELGIIDKFKQPAAPMTGIFFPDGFKPGPQVDIILYLHGHKAETAHDLSIDQYWNSKRFAYGAFREKLNAAGRNAILVAPTLGARSEAGALLNAGGLDGYLAKVLAMIGTFGAGARSGITPTLRHLVFACHSGGGLPMRRLAGGADKALTNLRECWGFDCTYNRGDDTFWAGWARKTPRGKCYFYYIKGSPTASLAEGLRDKSVANAIVQPSAERRHNYVPIAHWLERIQGAAFFEALGGGATPAVPPPQPQDEPADFKKITKTDFIAFVGRHARSAMAATGVPASVTVAQAILETGWGKHTIGSAKNLFGIKGRGPAGSVRVPTREFLNGQWVTIEAAFAKYDSFAQSIEDHAKFFLRNKRYAAALKVKDDPDSFAREIHKAGYATAPDYASQLIALMKRHNLYRFDGRNAEAA